MKLRTVRPSPIAGILWPFSFLLMAAAPLCLALDTSRLPSQWIERHWDQRSGLPSESLWDVHQDHDGYLWVASDIGLLRFDGIQFDLFNSETDDAFHSNDVRSIAQASDGTLWAATYGGGVVQRRELRFRRFGEEHGLVSPVVINVHVDRRDTLWAGTAGGVCRLAVGEERFRCWTPQDGVATGRIGRLAVDDDGALWAGSLDGGLTLIHEGTLRTFRAEDGLDSPQVFLAHRDPALGVIIGTYRGGLYAADTRWGVRAIDRGAIPEGSVTLSAQRDLDGNLWLGINQGGLRRHPDGYHIRTRSFDNPHPFGLELDREGGLWAATTRGLYQFRNGAFTPWGATEGVADSTFVIAESPGDQSVWIGTEGKGLFRVAGDHTISHYTTQEGLPAMSVSALSVDRQGRLWLGTFGGGVAVMRDGVIERKHSQRSSGLAGDQIAAIFHDRVGGTWIASPAGLNRLSSDQVTHTLTINDGLPNSYVRHISEHPDGRLLLATEEGLAFLTPSSVSIDRVVDGKDGLASAVIGASYADDRGVVWLGNRDGGLSRLEGDQLFQFTAEHGVPTRSVMAIVEDLQGHLWLAGRAGISRVPRDDLDAIARGERKLTSRARTFSEIDGLRTSRVFGGFHTPAIRANDGKIWFATSRGAVSVEPAKLTPRESALEVRIEGVRIDGVARALESPVRVPPNARQVEIDYSVPRLNDAQQLRFRYRLQERADLWQNATARRTAFFTSLPPRHRTFEVQADWDSSIEQFANARSTRLALYVEPAWHQTRWFQALIGLTLLGLAYLGYRVALRGQRRRQLSLERLVDQRTYELRNALETVEQMSRRDPLTQVANRRHFEERLREEWTRTVRHGLPLTVVLLDIDFFKQYNDSAGHLAGDDCLKGVAQALAANVRQHDFVARYGGEEFIALLPDTNAEAARIAAGRMQACIRELAIAHPGRRDGLGVVTASAGFSTAESGHVDKPEELIQRADEALYRAKSLGRDRVVFDRDPLPDPSARAG
ncbi:MAG: diguanylate cyclase [Pseudomonadota bacterium]